MKTKVADTSIIALYANLDKLNNREREVLIALKRLNCANNLMIGHYLNLPVNSITGRMFSLRKKNLVRYSETKKCPITGETTKYFKLVSYVNDILT